MPAYAVKEHVADPGAVVFSFPDAKTMYGGKKIAVGDVIYIFDSETQGGAGLCARGVVTEVVQVKRPAGRHTPRVSISVRTTAKAKRPLGRRELKRMDDWKDGRPQTEIGFRFYRQATNKIIGLSDTAAKFLERYF